MLFKTKETCEQENWPLTLKTVSNCIGKLLGTITVLSIFVVSSCSNYDDSAIRGGLSDLESRVSKLETLCSQMNSNITALQTIVNALQQKEFIESVTPLSDGQGYTLTFSSGKTATIYNGKDGKNGAAGVDGKDGANGKDGKNGVDGKDGKDGVDGRDGLTPSIGIRQHTDGVWYWTINADWLLDTDGNMVKAVGIDGRDGVNGKDGENGSDGKDGKDGKDGNNGNDGADGKDGKDGVTPKLKIEDGMWYVSCDGGVSWELLGRATGEDGTSAGIISVTEEDGYVRFGMQDGTVISIAKRQPLGISFSTSDVAITVGGGSKIIGYTLVGASENVVVKALVQDGWKAKINKKSPSEGTIEITAPSPLVESEILIFVSDGGQTALAAVNCVKSTVIITQEQYNVSASGGNIEVSGKTNLDFTVSIPKNAKSWLSLVQTKSLNPMSFTLSAEANSSPADRDAVISILDDAGTPIRTLSVRQSGDLSKLVSVQVDTKGELHTVLESYDKSRIVNLKISGVLNDVDFLDIYYEMPSLRYLDISDVEIETLPKDCFKKSTNVTTIILPKTLVSIPDDCFLQSKISGELVISTGCKMIGKSAFRGCSGLVSVTISAACEDIGLAAFADCSMLEVVKFESGSALKVIGGDTGKISGGNYLGVFSNCVSLKSIRIPASCEEIGPTAFINCTSLRTVEFESGSNLKIIGGGYYEGSYESSPSSYGAFSECVALTSITIPATCETIESAAFLECKSLEIVEFEPGSNLKEIEGGYGVYIEGKYTWNYHYFPYGAFSDCVSLKSIRIPATCETIGIAAFKNCKSLENVEFEPNSALKRIDGKYLSSAASSYGAFSTTSLKSIVIPASCEVIGTSAFRECKSLTDIYFESGSVLSSIGDYAFKSCGILHRISMQNCTALKEIGKNAFSENDQIYFFQIGTKTPPKLESASVFGSVGVYSVLKVPEGAESAYMSATGWREFSSITAID